MHRLYAIAGLILILLLWVHPTGAQGGGHVYIPSLMLDQPLMIVPLGDRAWDTSGLSLGVGWLTDTNWIGDNWGRVVLAGHSYGVFESLPDLQPGDMVVLWDAQQVVRYEVISAQVVPVTEVVWVLPTTAPTLALITCEGDTWRRVVVANRLP